MIPKSLQRRLTVLDAPSNLGLKPPATGEPGVKEMARVLREQGLVGRLHADDGGAVTPLRYAGAIDPVIKVRNANEIRDYTVRLADRLASKVTGRIRVE